MGNECTHYTVCDAIKSN